MYFCAHTHARIYCTIMCVRAPAATPVECPARTSAAGYPRGCQPAWRLQQPLPPLPPCTTRIPRAYRVYTACIPRVRGNNRALVYTDSNFDRFENHRFGADRLPEKKKEYGELSGSHSASDFGRFGRSSWMFEIISIWLP